MKRAIAGAIATMALVVPGAAAAATTYDGKVKGDAQATVKLKVDRSDGDRVVKSFVVKDLLIDCGKENARLKSATISGAANVSKKGKFKVKGSNGGQEFAVRGKLRGKRKARGTLRYSGPTSVDNQTLDCTSGRTGWKASR
jgi:hypothetical protein